MKTLLLSALLCMATLQMPGARSQPRPGMQDIYFFCSAVAETNDGIRRDEDFEDDNDPLYLCTPPYLFYDVLKIERHLRLLRSL